MSQVGPATTRCRRDATSGETRGLVTSHLWLGSSTERVEEEFRRAFHQGIEPLEKALSC